MENEYSNQVFDLVNEGGQDLELFSNQDESLEEINDMFSALDYLIKNPDQTLDAIETALNTETDKDKIEAFQVLFDTFSKYSWFETPEDIFRYDVSEHDEFFGTDIIGEMEELDQLKNDTWATWQQKYGEDMDLDSLSDEEYENWNSMSAGRLELLNKVEPKNISWYSEGTKLDGGKLGEHSPAFNTQQYENIIRELHDKMVDAGLDPETYKFKSSDDETYGRNLEDMLAEHVEKKTFNIPGGNITEEIESVYNDFNARYADFKLNLNIYR